MIRKRESIIILTVLLMVWMAYKPNPALAETIPHLVILQSRSLSPFEKARAGLLTSLLAHKLEPDKSLRLKVFILDDIETRSQRGPLKFYLQRNHPDLVVVIGTRAAQTALELIAEENLRIKLLYCLVGNPGKIGLDSNPNVITGIQLTIDPEFSLRRFRDWFPQHSTIGLLHDSGMSDQELERIRKAASILGVKIYREATDDPTRLPDVLDRLIEAVDAIWILHTERFFPKTILDRIMHQALINKIPVFGQSPVLLRRGALLSINHDWMNIGRQCGELAASLLTREQATDKIPACQPQSYLVQYNPQILAALGVQVPMEVLQTAKPIQQEE